MKKPEMKGVTLLEKKVFAYTDRMMPYLIAVLMTGMALYLRKVAVWWSFPEIVAGFDRHPRHIETESYYLILRMVQYLPLTPLHSMKWLAGLSDILLAVVVASMMPAKSYTDRLKRSLVYLLMLFSPVCFMRGILWAKTDSLAMVFLLIAYRMEEKAEKSGKRLPKAAKNGSSKSGGEDSARNVTGKETAAFLLAVLAGAIAPQTLLITVYYLWTKQKNVWIAAAAAGTVLVQLISGFLLGTENVLAESVYGMLRYLYCDPQTGAIFSNLREWICSVGAAMGLPVCMVLIVRLMEQKEKGRFFAAVLAHGVTVILYCSYLFTEETLIFSNAVR